MTKPNPTDYVKCKVCKGTFRFDRLSTHLSRGHSYSAQQKQRYYEKHYRQKGEGCCQFCKVPTRFKSMTAGYVSYCSTTCQNKERFQDPEFMAYWKDKKRRDQLAYMASEASSGHKAKIAKVSSKRMTSLHANDREFHNKTHKAAVKGLKKAWVERRAELLAAMAKGKDTDSFRKKRSDLTNAMLRDPNSKFGIGRQGKYHEYGGYTLRSSWELDFAKAMDAYGLKWRYEPKRFRLRLRSGKLTSYTPDFYLPRFDLYIEIKPDCFIDDLAEQKIERLRQKGYNIGFLTKTNWDAIMSRIENRDHSLINAGRSR